jgi:hypothetical protein
VLQLFEQSIDLLDTRGQHDDGNGTESPDITAHSESVATGQHYVQQDQIVWIRANRIDDDQRLRFRPGPASRMVRKLARRAPPPVISPLQFQR